MLSALAIQPEYCSSIRNITTGSSDESCPRSVTTVDGKLHDSDARLRKMSCSTEHGGPKKIHDSGEPDSSAV